MKLTPYHTLLWQKSFGSIIFFLMKHLAQLYKCPWWRLNNFGPSYSQYSLYPRCQSELAYARPGQLRNTPLTFHKGELHPKRFCKVGTSVVPPQTEIVPEKTTPTKFLLVLCHPGIKLPLTFTPTTRGCTPLALDCTPGGWGAPRTIFGPRPGQWWRVYKCLF